VMLFVAATAFNINDGVALTPLMVLYLLFFVTVVGVIVIAIDPGDPDVMSRPPRDPKLPIANRAAITSWVIYAAVLFVAAFLPLVIGPDEPKVNTASVSLTMTFAVMGFGTIFNALANRRDPGSGLGPPILKALAVSAVAAFMIALATELPGLQKGLLTTELSGRQWFACLGLAALLPIVIEGRKWLRRRATPDEELDVRRAVAPSFML
jgi:P-type Ca2+ transporter type 2C